MIEEVKEMPQIFLRRKNEKKVTEILEEVLNEFCQDYCKYPDIWDEEKEGCELSESELCQKFCPLNRL